MAPEKKNEGRFRFARGKRAYDSSRFGAPEPAAACVAQNVSAQSGRPSPSVAKPRADESAMRRTWERASILGVFKRCALGGGTDVVCACEHTRRSRSAFPPNKIAAGAGASPKSRCLKAGRSVPKNTLGAHAPARASGAARTFCRLQSLGGHPV